MTEAARWGPKSFLCTPEKLVPLMDLKSSMSVDSDTQSSSSGTGQTNAKGKKPEVINITTRYIRGTGIDPWGQVEEWRSLLGQSHPLYIGGKKFGIGDFMLTNVSAEDFYLSNAGEFIGVKVAITLEEKIVTVATTSKSNGNSWIGLSVTSVLSKVTSITQKAASAVSTEAAKIEVQNYAASAIVENIVAAKNAGISPDVYSKMSTEEKLALTGKTTREIIEEANPLTPPTETEKLNAQIKQSVDDYLKENPIVIPKKGGT